MRGSPPLGLISHSAVPTLLAAPGVTSLSKLIYSHYPCSRGAGGILGRRWQWGGGTPSLSRPLPAPRVAVGTAPGF